MRRPARAGGCSNANKASPKRGNRAPRCDGYGGPSGGRVAGASENSNGHHRRCYVRRTVRGVPLRIPQSTSVFVRACVRRVSITTVFSLACLFTLRVRNERRSGWGASNNTIHKPTHRRARTHVRTRARHTHTHTRWSARAHTHAYTSTTGARRRTTSCPTAFGLKFPASSRYTVARNRVFPADDGWKGVPPRLPQPVGTPMITDSGACERSFFYSSAPRYRLRAARSPMTGARTPPYVFSPFYVLKLW